MEAQLDRDSVVVFVDTKSSLTSATLTLPPIDKDQFGRLIIIRDKSNYFNVSSLILSTSSGDLFEYGLSTLELNHNAEAITFMSGPDYVWYKTQTQREPTFVVSTASIQRGVNLFSHITSSDTYYDFPPPPDGVYASDRLGPSSLLYAEYDEKSTLTLWFDNYRVGLESTFSTFVSPLVEFSTVMVASSFINYTNFDGTETFYPYMCDIEAFNFRLSNYSFHSLYAPFVEATQVIATNISSQVTTYNAFIRPNMSENDAIMMKSTNAFFETFYSAGGLKTGLLLTDNDPEPPLMRMNEIITAGLSEEQSERLQPILFDRNEEMDIKHMSVGEFIRTDADLELGPTLHYDEVIAPTEAESQSEKFIQGSLFFSSDNQYLELNPGVFIGGQDFTVDFFFRIDNPSTNVMNFIGGPENSSMTLYADPLASSITVMAEGTEIEFFRPEITQNNEWFHCALSRDNHDHGNYWNLWINGRSKITEPVETEELNVNYPAALIGSADGINQGYTGYMTNFRITIGQVLFPVTQRRIEVPPIYTPSAPSTQYLASSWDPLYDLSRHQEVTNLGVRFSTILPGRISDRPDPPAGDVRFESSRISWEPPFNGFTPILYYNLSGSPGVSTVSTTFSSILISSLITGQPYTFTINAVNKFGTSLESDPSEPVVPATIPDPPVDAAAIPSSQAAYVSWSAPLFDGYTPVLYYTVLYASDSLSTVSYETSTIFTGLTNGHEYEFTVTATNLIGTSPPSKPTNLVVPGTVPDRPEPPVAMPSSHYVSLEWTAPFNGYSSIGYYLVKGLPDLSTISTTSTFAEFNNLTNGTEYRFAVAAVNWFGSSFFSNNSDPVIPGTAPDRPAQPFATPSTNAIILDWIPPFNGYAPISYYTVEGFPDLSTFTTKESYAVIENLVNGNSYAFAVAATNMFGTSLFSSDSLPVVPGTVPDQPDAPIATPSSQAAILNWVAPSDGFSPILYYVVDGYPDVPLFSTQGTSTVVDGLENGTEYVFRVAAINFFGLSLFSSDSLPVVPATVPDRPDPPTAIPSSHSALLNWIAPSDGFSPILYYNILWASDLVSTSSAATSTIITGLTNGDVYTFKVAAVNIYGSGLYSTDSLPIIPGTIPDQPVAPTATARDHAALVRWIPPPNGFAPILYYILEGAPGIEPRSTTNISSLVTGLDNGSPYTFKVAAINRFGSSLFSSDSLPVYPISSSDRAPDQPGRPVAIPGNTNVILDWVTPPSHGLPIIDYEVTGHPDGGVTTYSHPTYVNGLTNGTSYTFTVVAISAAGPSIPSEPSYAVIPGTVPGRPDAPHATAYIGSAQVDWTAPADDGGPPILYYTIDGEPTIQTRSTISTTTMINSLLNGTQYTFTVAAVNYFGPSLASLPSNPVIPGAPPNKPDPPVAVAGHASATLTWVGPSDSSAPILYYIVEGEPSVSTISTIETSTIITGLTNGVEYTFTLAAVNAVSSSVFSDPSNPVIPFGTLPSTPTDLVVTGGNQEASLNWTAAYGGGYSAFYYSIKGIPSIGNLSTTATSTIITGLTNGTEYGFAVATTNQLGSSEFTNYVYAVPATYPDPPAAPSVVAGDHEVMVSWQPPANTGGAPVLYYNLEGLPDVSTFSTLATSSLVTGLINGTEYNFRVAAVNAISSSQFSDYSESVYPFNPSDSPMPPGRPTNLVAVPGNQQAEVSWTAPTYDGGSAILYYQAYGSPTLGLFSLSHTPVVVSSITETTSTILTGLVNGITYLFTAVAVNAYGSSQLSLPSNPVIPANHPEPLTAPPTAVAGNKSATVSWFEPSDNGGSPILYYILEGEPGVAALSTPELTLTVSTLTAGTSYTFRVAPVNVMGPAPFSAYSEPVVPMTVPDAPDAPSTISGDSRVDLSWSAPAYDGGSAVLYYIVDGEPDVDPISTTELALSVSTLINGTSYTFTVAAANVFGPSLFSAASAPTIPATFPSAPAAPTATAGDTEVALNWLAPTSDGGSAILSYTIYNVNDDIDYIISTTSTVVTGLTNGTPYTFTVAATNIVGTGPYSDPCDPVTPFAATVPATPAAPTAVAGVESATVTWIAPSDDGGAAILYYLLESDPSTITQSTIDNTFLVSSLTSNTPYTFTVAAVNTVGPSAYSQPSNTVIPLAPPTVPAIPAAPTAVAGLDSATVDWFAPSDDGGSAILYYLLESDPATETLSTVQSSLTVSSLTRGTPYTFAVAAVNTVGPSPFSGPSNQVTPPVTAPDAPEAPVATGGNAEVTLNWTAPYDGGSAILGYTIVNLVTEVTYNTSTTTAVVTDLINGTPYTFTVAAVNLVGPSAASDPSNEITPVGPPAAPAAPTAVAGVESATVNWIAPSDDGGSAILYYLIESDPSTATLSTTDTTLLVSSLIGDTPYTFTVAAVNIVGPSAYSDPSNTVTPTGATVPAAPAAPTAVAGVESATVTWVAPSDDGGSAILYYLVESDPATTTLSTTETTFLVSSLTSNTPYTFTVAAANAVGPSAYSQPSNTVTPTAPPTVPAVPAAPTAVAGVDSATVSWFAPSDDGGSAILYYLIESDPATATLSTAETTLLVSSLTRGNPYTFTVAAVNTVGPSAYSQPSNTVIPPATAPDTPEAPVATGGDAEVTLNWTAPYDGGSAILSYTVFNTVDEITYTTSTTTAVVTGLANGTPYTFTVAATNAVSTSAYSEPSNSVTPEAPPTVPAAPAAPVATGGIESATLNWFAPSDDGGSAILYYLVDSDPSTATLSTTDTTLLVSSLTGGTPYVFVVAAVNSVGPSLFSDPSNTVTPTGPTVPDPPGTPTVIAANGAVVVHWSPPASNGGAAITGYIVYNDDGYTSELVSTTLWIVPGLTNGQEYTFAVAARNSIGDSDVSQISVGVTPAETVDNFALISSRGDNLMNYSYDGLTWTPVTGYPLTDTRAIVWNGSLWIAIGAKNAAIKTIATSTDGITWEELENDPFVGDLGFGLGWNGTYWLAGSSDGIIAASSNGVDWTVVGSIPIGAAGNSIVWNGSYWLIGAWEGGIYKSSDGSTWINTLSELYRPTVAWNGSYWVVAYWQADGSGGLSKSSDGESWSAVAHPFGTGGAAGVVWNGSYWLTRAEDGLSGFARSDDGVSWTITSTEPFSYGAGYDDLSFGWNGALWIATGRNFDGSVSAVISPDAVSWIPALSSSFPSGQTFGQIVAPRSAASFALRVPAAPAAPVATAEILSATLEWSAPSDNGGSEILYYYVKSDPPTAILSTMETSITFSSLSTIAYTFTVAALNIVGRSLFSQPSNTITPSPSVPDAPAAPVAIAGNAEVTLNWSPPASDGGAEILSYIVFNTVDEIEYNTSTTTTSTVITGLTNDTPYTFTVAAVNIAGPSIFSEPSNSVTPTAPPPATVPAAPAAPTATAGIESATVNWFAPSDDGGSAILYYIVESDPPTTSLSTVESTLLVSSLTSGTPYVFGVAAVNSVGTSLFSDPSNTVTPTGATVPDAPAAPTVISGDGAVVVHWSPPASDGGSAIIGYIVYNDDGYTSELVSTTLLIVPGLTNGQEYLFVVAARNTIGDSDVSQASIGVTPAETLDNFVLAHGRGADPTNYSYDGLTWTPVTDCSLTNITTVLWNGSLWVAIGADDPARTQSIAVSFDGINWSAPTNDPFAGNIGYGLGWNGTYWLAGSYTGEIAASSDGLSWTIVGSIPEGRAGPTIVWNGSYWLLAAMGYGIYKSTDGTTWTSILSGLYSSVVAWNGSYWVLAYWQSNGTGGFKKSSDGENWTDATTNPLSVGGASGVVWNGSYWLARDNIIPGNGFAKSSDGMVWTLTTTSDPFVAGAGYDMLTFNWNGALWIATARNADSSVTVMISPDATRWIPTLTNPFPGTDNFGHIIAPRRAATFALRVPAAPAPPVATAATLAATVEWFAPSDDGGSAILYYLLDSDPATTTLSTTMSSLLVSSLLSETPYTFTVAAVNTIGQSLFSQSSNEITPSAPTVPDAPTAPTAEAGDTTATLTWLAPANDGGSAILSYRIVNEVDESVYTSTELTYLVTDLINGTAYTFTVAATNAVGTGDPSDPCDPVTPSAGASTAPDAPAAPVATAGNAEVSLTWSPPTDDGGSAITSYTVLNAVDEITYTTSTTTVVLTGLTNGTPYTFNVSATNAVGTSPYSDPSNEVTPATVPDAPAAPTAEAGDTTVTLNWSAPSNGGSPISSYTVLNTVDEITYTVEGTTAVITGLTNDTPYTFTVAATNAIGTGTASDPSNEVTPTAPPPATVPAAPDAPVATAGIESATVTWFAPSDDGGSAILYYQIESDPAIGTLSTSETTITVSSLTSGTPIAFAVAAVNLIGPSAFSGPSNTVTPTAPPLATVPAAPDAPVATAGIESATVTWFAPSDDGGSAILYYLVDSNPVTGTVSSIETTITLSSLISGTPYTFIVSAVNAVGEGAQSAASNEVTPTAPEPTVPDAPDPPTAEAGDTTVTLTWSAPASDGGSAILTYKIYNVTTDDEYTTTDTDTTYVVTGLINGTEYTFNVAATNAVGTGAYSDPCDPVTPVGAATVPGAPSTPTATAGDAQVELTWNAPASDGGSAILSYTVYAYTAPDTYDMVDTTSETTMIITPLINGTPYQFVVTATNAVGEGAYSAPVEVTPVATTVPDAPISLSPIEGDRQVTLTWTAPANDGGSAVLSYTVYVYTAPATYDLVDTTSETSLIITGLTNGTGYQFVVTATNAVGESAYSDPSTEVTPAMVPDAPTDLVATAGDGQVTLRWTAPANDGGSTIANYKIYIYTDTYDLVDSTTQTSKTITGLINGTLYKFAVTAVNFIGEGAYSDPSNQVTPEVAPTAPDAPDAPTAVAGDTEATITWSAPASDGGSAITKYYVYGYGTGLGPGFNLLAETTELTFTATGLDNGTAYTFTVSAVNAVGEGAQSAASNEVTPTAGATVPDAPDAPTAVAGNGEATITWTAPASDGGSAIIKYFVYGNDTGLGETTELTFTATQLDNGTPYTFTVSAVNAVGEGAQSAASNEVTPEATAPDAPTGLSATAGDAQVELSWTAPTNNGGSEITGYRIYQYTAPDTYDLFDTTAETTITLAPLINGTAYQFVVTAVNAIDESAYSEPTAEVTPTAGATVPDAPTGVTAVAGDRSVTVSWSAPASDGGSAIAVYNIYRYIAGWGLSLYVGAEGNETSITIGAVLIENGTAYQFVVTAVNTVGESVYSEPTSEVTPATVPGTPDPPTVYSMVGGALVYYIEPSDNGGSAILYYTLEGEPGISTISTVAGNGFTVGPGLDNGSTYTFMVAAVNAAGSSAYSAPASTVIGVPWQPEPPTIYSVPYERHIVFQAPYNILHPVFDPPPVDRADADYFIFEADPYVQAVSTTPSGIVTMDGLFTNIPYTFTQTAVNGYGQSAPSLPTAPQTLPTTHPDPVSSLTATQLAGGTVRIDWIPPYDGGSPITSYRVDNRGPSLPQELNSTYGAEVSSITASGLLDGTYSIVVGAYNGVDDLAVNGEFLAFTMTNLGPGRPEPPTTTPGFESANVEWIAPSDNGSPILYYTVDGSPGVSPLSTADTFLLVGGLTTGQSYTFRVAATNDLGTSAYSEPSYPPVIPGLPPGRPEGLVALPRYEGAALSWIEPSDNGYPLLYYQIGVYYNSLPDHDIYYFMTTTAASTVLISSLINQQYEYEFSVEAYNIIGGSGESAFRSNMITPGVSQPDRMDPPQAASGYNSATVSWTVPYDNGSPLIWMIIEAQQHPSFFSSDAIVVYEENQNLYTISTHTFTGPEFVNGAEFSFRVRAVNQGPAPISVFSDPSPIITVGAPGTPEAPVSSPILNGLNITWIAPSDGFSPIQNYSLDGGFFVEEVYVPSVGALVGAQNSFTFLDLPPPAQPWSFRVLASNAQGNSQWSPLSIPATPFAPPDPVTDLVATVVGNHIELTWSAPFNGGFSIARYEFAQNGVHCGSNSGTSAALWPTSGLSVSYSVRAVSYDYTTGLDVDGPWSANTPAITAP